MILRQLCAAIAPIYKIGAILVPRGSANAAQQPADLSRLAYI
jgi:hypothetical protein